MVKGKIQGSKGYVTHQYSSESQTSLLKDFGLAVGYGAWPSKAERMNWEEVILSTKLNFLMCLGDEMCSYYTL